MYNTDMPSRADLPSTAKLIRSTIISAVVALVLLVTVVMPAEYAMDPTGVGRLLGLTEMGEIKQQLAEEAAADEAAQLRGSRLPAPLSHKSNRQRQHLHPRLRRSPNGRMKSALCLRPEKAPSSS